MTTLLTTLSDDELASIRAMCETVYLDGQCYTFAGAMHQLTGWPIHALRAKHDFRHAFVVDPEGNKWDVRGAVSPEEFGDPFGVPPPYDTRLVTLDDLRTVRDISDFAIIQAIRLIEVLWPHLPYIRETETMRKKRFADGLERLSRETGIWIRSAVPACPPVLADAAGDEGGYNITVGAFANVYCINRYLKK